MIVLQTDYQKVVCNRSHSSVSENDPNDDQVATSRNDDHDGEEHRPEDNPPPRQTELVILCHVLQETVVLTPIIVVVIKVQHHIRVTYCQVPIIPQESHRALIPKGFINSVKKQKQNLNSTNIINHFNYLKQIKFKKNTV